MPRPLKVMSTAIVNILNCEGYKHDPDLRDGRRQLALVIVLDDDTNEERLKMKELGHIDETIEWARPHVLKGLL
jgi:hypothetical protein